MPAVIDLGVPAMSPATAVRGSGTDTGVIAHEVPMHSFTRYGRRLGGATLLLCGALVPTATVRAQAAAAASAKPDSAAKKDSALTHTASGKRSRLGAFGRAAASKANSAADKVSQTTGVSKGTMAKVALASTGVGAAAMLAKPESGTSGLTGNIAASAGRTMLQKMKDARAGRNGAKVGATPNAPGGPTGGIPVGAGMTAQQIALYQQQMAQAQAGAMQGNAMAGGMGGGSVEMQRLQQEYMQMVLRAQSGDKDAARQMMRFSQEWGDAAMRLQARGPAAMTQSAYESAMRDALTCATKGSPCRTKPM